MLENCQETSESAVYKYTPLTLLTGLITDCAPLMLIRLIIWTCSSRTLIKHYLVCHRCTIEHSVPHPVPLKPTRWDGEAGKSRAGWGHHHGHWTTTWSRTSAALYRRSPPPPAPSSQVVYLWCLSYVTSCTFICNNHDNHFCIISYLFFWRSLTLYVSSF